MKTFLTGGITAVPGILAAGMAAGIKKADVPDLALIVSEREATAAGGFTLNKVVAAPVILHRHRLRRGNGRATAANSGSANARTGGFGSTRTTERIDPASPARAGQLRRDGGEDAARAIMTTDTTVKMVVATDTLGGRTITVGGIAKGSGMIHPNMATMLAFLAT